MNEENFLLLTGAEYDISERDKPIRFGHGRSYHLSCIAKRPNILWQPFADADVRDDVLPYLEKAEVENMVREYDTDAINAIIARANEKDHLVIYNHPAWSLQEYPDYIGLKGLWGIEICNYGSVVMGYGDSDNSMVYRDLMNQVGRIMPICADDFHSIRDLGGGWIMVASEKLAYDSVILALEEGNFYASTGPEIHSLVMEGAELQISCSDARQITVVCGNRYARRAVPKHNDGLLRNAVFNLATWLDNCQGMPGEWFRVIVQGPYGHFATTRAYTADEIRKE